LAAVLQATIPIFGMFFAHVMLPDEPLQLPKLLGVLLALGGVTLICGRLLGFNSPLAFWGGVAVVVGAASAAYANVLVRARSIQLAPDMLAAWSSISIKSTSRRSNRRLNSVAWRRSAGMKSYDRSHSRQRSLRRIISAVAACATKWASSLMA
jgi:hypothetical protein